MKLIKLVILFVVLVKSVYAQTEKQTLEYINKIVENNYAYYWSETDREMSALVNIEKTIVKPIMLTKFFEHWDLDENGKLEIEYLCKEFEIPTGTEYPA